METDWTTRRAHVLRIDAAGAYDAASIALAPAAMLIELAPDPPDPRLIAIASPADIDAHPASPHARRIDLPRAIVIPALVNAHTHLDLTHIGPKPLPRPLGEGGFHEWIELVRTGRPTTPNDIRAAVEEGIRLSLAGGVAAVGDIAGAAAARITLTPFETLANSPLRGVSFLEFFARGRREPDAAAALTDALAGLPNPTPRVRPGLQPHAPTTVSRALFQRAIDLAKEHNLPLSTHLAETPAEREFIATGAGPQRDFFQSIGLWTDDILQDLGPTHQPSHHPVAYMQDLLAQAPILCAHVNDATDEAIEILGKTRTPVAYCPRASDYFGAHHHFGPHRYRDMFSAGVPVCLGTDSIINLPPGSDERERGRISTLDEMRFLHARDSTDPTELLRMATTAGASALHLDPGLFTLAEGPIAGLVSIDIADDPPTLASALRSASNPNRVL